MQTQLLMLQSLFSILPTKEWILVKKNLAMYSQKSTLVSSSTTQNSIYNILLPTQITACNYLSHNVVSKNY